jgi:hypothetical protein
MRSLSIIASDVDAFNLKTEAGTIVGVHLRRNVEARKAAAGGQSSPAATGTGTGVIVGPIIDAPRFKSPVSGQPEEIRTIIAPLGASLDSIAPSWKTVGTEQRHLILHQRASDAVDLKAVTDAMEPIDAHVTLIVRHYG